MAVELAKVHRLALHRSLWLSVALVTAGCGGGGGSDTSLQPSPAPGTTTSPSAPAPAPATAPAPAPAAAAGSAILSWSPSSGTVAGYRVYYGTASRNYQQARGNGIHVTSSAATLTDLPAGFTYYFAVTAIDASGLESDYSSEASKSIP
jgi:hypothetical protein